MARARFCAYDVAQFVSKDHEVHRTGCTYWPSSNGDLGEHETCRTAIAAAKRLLGF
jgi:hypothetical protein